MFGMSFLAMIWYLLPLILAIVALKMSLKTQRQLKQEIYRLEFYLKNGMAESRTNSNTSQDFSNQTTSNQAASSQSTSNQTTSAPLDQFNLNTQQNNQPLANQQLARQQLERQQIEQQQLEQQKLDQSLTDRSFENELLANQSVENQPLPNQQAPLSSTRSSSTRLNLPPSNSPASNPWLEPDEQSANIVTSVWHSFLNWFKGGNAIVRVGVIILLVGVVLLLRLANDLFSIPIEVRLGAVAAGGVGLTLLGLKLRQKRRGYALSIQGAGLAIVYFTLFAAFRLYDILPPNLAFILLAALALISAALALMQNALPLALLAFGGGFLAPLLTSTGSNNLVGLFSYYLILNLALAWLAHYKTWKVLNVLGAAMTFGVAGYLGWNSFELEMRWPLEALLIAHLALYLFIVVRYSQQLAALPHEQSVNIAPVDSGLLFGVPLMGFGLQAALLHDIPYALAFSSAVLSAIYLIIGYKLFYQNKQLRMLTEGVLALSVGFMALVLPLALNSQWTAAGWAVQGAALVWIGRRQQRIWSTRFGLLLQVLSTVALWNVSKTDLSLVLPLVVYSICLFICAVLLRSRINQPIKKWLTKFSGTPLSTMSLSTSFLMLVWAFFASMVTLDQMQAWSRAADTYWLIDTFKLSFYPLIFIFLAILVTWRMYWPQLTLFIKIILGALSVHTVFIWLDYVSVSEHIASLLLLILAYISFWLLSIRRVAAQSAHSVVESSRFEQVIGFMGLLIYSSVLLMVFWLDQSELAMIILPLGLLVALLLVKKPLSFLTRERLLRDLSVPISLALIIWILLVNGSASGQLAGLPYVPVLNLLDICILVAALVVYRLIAYLPVHLVRPAQALLGVAIFLSLTSMIVRTLHQWVATPLWQNGAWYTDTVQTSLTIFWTLGALVLTYLASRYAWRHVWMVGIALLALVVVKLLVIDLSNVAAIARIVSFIGAGLIMLLIGYVAPLPPSQRKVVEGCTDEGAGEK